MVERGGIGRAVKEGEDIVIMESEGSIPVEAKAMAGLKAKTGGHSGIGDEDYLHVVIYRGDGVGACVGGEGGHLLLTTGHVGLEPGIAAAGATTKWVPEREVATVFLAGLRRDQEGWKEKEEKSSRAGSKMTMLHFLGMEAAEKQRRL